MPLLSNKYFKWLQADSPRGDVEKYPVIDGNGETPVEGVYIAGDLTGVPLLKFAAENGKKLIDHIWTDPGFQKQRIQKADPEVIDVIIVGAGPAGISAGIEAMKYNMHVLILESAQKFNTVKNFPKGKPIFAEPADLKQESALLISDGTKESLLTELSNQTDNYSIPILEGIMVDKITKRSSYLEINTEGKVFKALRVILAIGKSGNSRMLNVPGENLPKVFNRLFDPADASSQNVLVVGGGDSALETAIATAAYANRVTISYRKLEFSRPKEGNLIKLNSLVAEGKIRILLGSTVKEIKENSVILVGKSGDTTEIDNTMVLSMIGKELPLELFKRSNIRMEGDLSFYHKLQFVLLVLFAGVLYFGKSSQAFSQYFYNGKAQSFGEAFGQLWKSDFWIRLISLPGLILSDVFSNRVSMYNATEYVNALLAWLCFIVIIFVGIYVLGKFARETIKNFSFGWRTFKYSYFGAVGIFFVIVFFGDKYYGVEVLSKPPVFWYGCLYSVTIVIFGVRRIVVKSTKYITLQTLSLMLIQVFPLFLLPEIIFPYLGKAGAFGASDGFIMTQVFPNGSYWRTYGLVLAWPLNLGNLYNGHITAFWLIFSLLQSFIIIPLMVYKWGKGAYCGWICSCGALAETLGDEYRTLAPHGARAKKMENIGQWVLAVAFIITAVKLISVLNDVNIPLLNQKFSYTADFLQKIYYFSIDVIFSGVLGVGVYFFLSGRVWCRFGCPLAALMHIYARFSKYRIFSEKKKCISCNICTKVCHMGIDVMNYANKGIPMNDVECVRCSACIVSCPTQVLTFGSLPQMDTANTLTRRMRIEPVNKSDWRSGL